MRLFTNRVGGKAFGRAILFQIALIGLVIQYASAALSIARPTLVVGQTATYELCGVQQLPSPAERMLVTSSKRDSFFSLEVLGRGDYLGFRNVYTVSRNPTYIFQVSKPVHYVIDEDLNRRALYDPQAGTVTVRYFGNREHAWPIYPGKAWRYDGHALSQDGLRVVFRGEVTVTALQFQGKEYLQQFKSLVARLPDREVTDMQYLIIDRTGEIILIDDHPRKTSTGMGVGTDASCLKDHPINGLVSKVSPPAGQTRPVTSPTPQTPAVRESPIQPPQAAPTVSGPQPLPSIDALADRTLRNIPPGTPDAIRAGSERERQRLQRLSTTTVLQIRTLDNQGQAAIRDKNWRRCVDIYAQVLSLDPDSYLAFFNQAACLYELGILDRAIERAVRAISWIPDPGLYFTVASCYVKKNDRNRAFAWLERAVQGGFTQLTWIENNFGPFRDDPRYQTIVNQIR